MNKAVANPGAWTSSEIEELAAQVAELAGESRVEAIHRALMERLERLQSDADTRERLRRAMEFLQHEVWPLVPEDQLGRSLTREEEDELLGYTGDGV
jgi:antitoxin VapB